MEALLTCKDVAARLAMSECHIRRMVCRRRIPFIKIGGAVRFSEADIDDWLYKRKITPGDIQGRAALYCLEHPRGNR